MILHVPFTCPVCIESILLYPGRSDLSVRVRDYGRFSHTQRCAAFVNRPNGIDFDDALAVLDGRLGPASTGRAQADFALLPGATDVTAYPVSVSRFSHTSSVSLLLVRASAKLTTHSSTHWLTHPHACTMWALLARHSTRGRTRCTGTTCRQRRRPHTKWMASEVFWGQQAHRVYGSE